MPPDNTWTVVRSVVEAKLLIEAILYFEISLDHDMGGDSTTRELVLWCIENDKIPRGLTHFTVHSANPVGREWLEGMIERYLS